MKKVLSVFLIGLLILVGCSSKKESYQITPAEAIELLDQGQDIILYLGSKDCSACQAFAPVFKEVAEEYPEKLYYIEILSAQTDHKADYEKLLADYIGKLAATPSIFAINDKKVVDKHTGIMTYTELENMMSRNNIK